MKCISLQCSMLHPPKHKNLSSSWRGTYGLTEMSSMSCWILMLCCIYISLSFVNSSFPFNSKVHIIVRRIKSWATSMETPTVMEILSHRKCQNRRTHNDIWRSGSKLVSFRQKHLNHFSAHICAVHQHSICGEKSSYFACMNPFCWKLVNGMKWMMK